MALTNGLADHRRQLSEFVAAASVTHLTQWVAEHPDLVARMLHSAGLTAQASLRLLIAVRNNPSLAVFEGDPMRWFAAHSGMVLADVHRFWRCARWLFQPSLFPLEERWADVERAERLAHSRELQERLRAVFDEAQASLWVMHTCKAQTDFLCTAAKALIVPIVERVLTELGPRPDSKSLLDALQEAVRSANRAYEPDQGHHSYLQFSRVRNGMMAIRGFCTAREGALVQNALRSFARAHGVDPALPEDKRAFRALVGIVSAQGPAALMSEAVSEPADGKAPLQYRVNVNVTVEEFERLCREGRGVAETDRGESVPWAEIAAGRVTPIDAVTLIGGHGAQVREFPQARFFTPDQRDWMLSFQVRCAYPGCGVAARDCEAHHIVPVSRGGATTAENLVLVCASHHARNDDSHAGLGRFHFAKDGDGIPFVQDHPQRAGDPLPRARYNRANQVGSAAARARAQAQARARARQVRQVRQVRQGDGPGSSKSLAKVKPQSRTVSRQ